MTFEPEMLKSLSKLKRLWIVA